MRLRFHRESTLAQFLLKITISDVSTLQEKNLVMLNTLTSPGLMHLSLDFTQDFAMLGAGLFVLILLSGAMIVTSAVADAFSRHLVHGH